MGAMGSCSHLIGFAGRFSVVPYNMVLKEDPGSPLFIAFVTHIFIVVINTPTLISVIRNGLTVPVIWHLFFIFLGFTFNKAKSSAVARGPVTFCMLMTNMQMLTGVVVQLVFYGQRYNMKQITGCGLISAGVGLAACACATPKVGDDVLTLVDVGQSAFEMILSCVALTFLTIYIQKVFAKHGEAVNEQLLIQHLGGVPAFLLGTQWAGSIGPRVKDWITGGNYKLMLILLSNLAMNYAETLFRTQMTSRCPSTSTVQLVETLKRFLNLVFTAVMQAPPFPGVNFWLGSIMLSVGTVVYLTSVDKKKAE